ncbi:hypothetical protein NQ317_013239 [Molorchus minor]|uniref:Reverse transcriptase domain-containing protein n=1 Tax=Molorchus minor TaxID=1323400 RepID=A0ABQ9JRJ8_9CUCU|nr:hypothetical protein NQ317_013239 [Molorchus minor]
MKEQDLSRVIGEGKEAVLRAHTSAAIVDGTMQLIQRACDQSMPRKRPPHGRKKAVYWWTEEIADLRGQCLRLRRIATRARRRNEEMAAEAHEEFRLARRNLKQTIYRSKKAKWEELRQSVDTDPWGLGYKIVMRKLGSYSPRPSMDANQMGHIVDTLFPSFPERQRIPAAIPFQVEDEEMEVKAVVKYLGVRLDTKLTFWAQIQHAAEAASKVTTALSRLMANVGGPTAKKRRLLMSVTDSIILYGCDIWADALQKEKYRKVVASVQRRGALRIASAYRTVSEPAVLVIADVMPIDLRATERKTAYSTKEEVGAKEAKARARIQAMQRWQERWREEHRGRFDAERRVLEGQIGHLDPDTIVEAMIRSQDVWNKVEVFVRAVLLLKKPELDRHIEG